MKKTTNPKAGDRFRVIVGDDHFHPGEVISLKEDDGSSSPLFWKEDESGYYNIHFSDLGPYTKTIRDAQVGDIVIRGRNERMVLERGQNTVMLSRVADFEVAGISYHFHELEEYFTLKNAPDVKSAKIAEAIELLKKAGYKITKE